MDAEYYVLAPLRSTSDMPKNVYFSPDSNFAVKFIDMIKISKCSNVYFYIAKEYNVNIPYVVGAAKKAKVIEMPTKDIAALFKASTFT